MSVSAGSDYTLVLTSATAPAMPFSDAHSDAVTNTVGNAVTRGANAKGSLVVVPGSKGYSTRSGLTTYGMTDFCSSSESSDASDQENSSEDDDEEEEEDSAESESEDEAEAEEEEDSESDDDQEGMDDDVTDQTAFDINKSSSKRHAKQSKELVPGKIDVMCLHRMQIT